MIVVKKAIAALGIGAVAVSVSSINASALEKGTVTASALKYKKWTKVLIAIR